MYSKEAVLSFSYTWDTPIAHILGPSFRLANDLLSKSVNLRDVLAHKVGVPSNFSPLLVGFPENTTREDFVRHVLRTAYMVFFLCFFLLWFQYSWGLIFVDKIKSQFQ